MKVYRVVDGRIVDSDITVGEAANTRLPLGKTITGFWSRDPAHSVNLILDIAKSVEEEFGGGLWDKEVMVLEATIQDGSDGTEYRTGPFNERYDGSEIFVQNISEYKVHTWKKFLERYG